MRNINRSLSNQVKKAQNLKELESALDQAKMGKRGRFGGRSISVKGGKGSVSLTTVIKKLDDLAHKEKLTSEELETATRLYEKASHFDSQASQDSIDSKIKLLFKFTQLKHKFGRGRKWKSKKLKRVRANIVRQNSALYSEEVKKMPTEELLKNFRETIVKGKSISTTLNQIKKDSCKDELLKRAKAAARKGKLELVEILKKKGIDDLESIALTVVFSEGLAAVREDAKKRSTSELVDILAQESIVPDVKKLHRKQEIEFQKANKQACFDVLKERASEEVASGNFELVKQMEVLHLQLSKSQINELKNILISAGEDYISHASSSEVERINNELKEISNIYVADFLQLCSARLEKLEYVPKELAEPVHFSVLFNHAQKANGKCIMAGDNGVAYRYTRSGEGIQIGKIVNGEFKIKIQIKVDHAGIATALQVDGKAVKKIPEELVSMFDQSINHAINQKTFYETPEGWVIGQAHRARIGVVRKDVRLRPENHLAQFTKLLEGQTGKSAEMDRNMGHTRPADSPIDVKLKVAFISETLKPEKGADSGGLTRQFFNDMMEGLVSGKNGKVKMVIVDGVARPKANIKMDMETFESEHLDSLSESERKIFQQMGMVFMYCYNSKNTFHERSHFDDSVSIGRHFDDSLFEVALQFKPDELDRAFSDLSEKRKLELAELLMNNRKNMAPKEHEDAFSILKKGSFDELSEQELKGVIAFGQVGMEDWVEDCVANDATDAKNKIIVNGTAYDLSKVKLKWSDARKSVLDVVAGVYYPQLSPIHAIAQGMREETKLWIGGGSEEEKMANVNAHWSGLQDVSAKDFSNKVQGSLDRADLASRLKLSIPEDATDEQVKVLKQKQQWLQELLKSEDEFSDEELKQLLTYITGAASLPPGKVIDIKVQVERLTPEPVIHTCGFQMDFSPEFSKGTDDTKEDFKKLLKLVMSDTAMSVN